MTVEYIECDSFIYAKEYIPCECPECRCPASGGSEYSFRYVDEERKCIYYDVPKAASSTIRRKLDIGKLPHHSSLKNPVNELRGYFTFTVVRNPWDRMYSNWKMFTTQKPRIRQLKSMTNLRFRKFSDFVDFAIKHPNHHWQEQSLYVPNEIDFIGKMEDMPATLETLGRHIPNFNTENTIVNATEIRHRADNYKEMYDEITKNKVADFYRNDIIRFNYSF